MTKRNILLLSLAIFSTSMLTGCSGIKFIEKVSETTEDLGSIDEESEDLGKIDETAEDIESETTEEVIDTSIETVCGIKFKKKNSAQMFLKEDAAILKTPEEKAQISESLLKGEPINVIGESENGKWYMARHFDGPIVYILKEYVSEKYVRPDAIHTPSETTETTESTEQTKPSETKSESEIVSSSEQIKPSETNKPSSQKPESTKPSSESQKPSSESTPPSTSSEKPVDPGYLTDGIPFPENPTSTSINLGVLFADVDIILKVTYDNTTANTGPGKATTSTGYEAKQVFMKGDTVACTGIGENGYCRVELANGVIAFIDGTHLTK